MSSYKVNPEWVARSQAMAAQAVAQDNARSQEIRNRALQAIADNQRQTSAFITSGYEERSRVYDEISRKRSNATLGTVDVVDPSSGRHKVENYSDYHWMQSGNGCRHGDEHRPGSDWRQLVTLP